MCGRFVAASPADDIARYFDAAVDPEARAVAPRWNVAPTDAVTAVVAARDGGRELRAFRWGLVPSWSPDAKGAARLINARAETVAKRPAFATALRRRRAIVPMDGFYEWVRPARRPVFVHRRDGEPLAVAALWEVWRAPSAPPDAPWLRTVTVVTTQANATVAPVHDRMPVILPASAWATWLDRATDDVGALTALLRPAPDTLLALRPVSTAVNAVAHDGPDLMPPCPPPPNSGLHSEGPRLALRVQTGARR